MAFHISDGYHKNDELATRQLQSKKQKFGRNLEKYLKQYNEATGIHGVRYLSEKRTIVEKIFWTIVLILSLTSCVFMIYGILNKFDNSPVVVNFLSTDYPIYKIPFPSVTICPKIKSTHHKFNYTDVFDKLVEKGDQVTPETLRNFYYINVLCNEVGGHSVTLMNGNETVDDNFFKIIDELKVEPLIFCKYMEYEYDCSEIFTPTIIDEGICYSFNVLDREELFKEHVRDNVNLCPQISEGFRVFIDNAFNVPRFSRHFLKLPLDQDVAMAVEPQLVLSSEAVNKFSSEKRKCYLRREPYLRHFKMYTQSSCLLECLTNYTLTKCGCAKYTFSIAYLNNKLQFCSLGDNETAICGTGRSDCVQDAEIELKHNEMIRTVSEEVKEGETYCDCKPSCTELTYRVETSQTNWHQSRKMAPSFNHSEDYSYSVLTIYFKVEHFRPMERCELYDLSDLISNFGGLLGLFTGFSVISLVEIIYFLTLRIFCNMRLYGMWSGPTN
ncbi:ASC domain containing protein [Asbolus verrucosus]|uniref:ASC domain containing protein n=1 Tax=Asbolus verrucosus TaxID=1661398 RepID=A0A482WAT3_ASBVE|nr:ASC domain containing protein [Asbolus verrucosus]